jgi:peptide deformylase
VVDASPFSKDDEISDDEISTLKNFKKVFINPELIEETGGEWDFTEGCLSIPNIREDISRREMITIRYYDESFEEIELTLKGLAARIVQHEYDHIEGVLFIDKLSSLKKKLLKGKLNDISKGKIKTEYKMRYPQGKIKR